MEIIAVLDLYIEVLIALNLVFLKINNFKDHGYN